METRKRKSSETSLCVIPPPSKEEVRYAILFGFRRKLDPQNIFKECVAAFGDYAPSIRSVYVWFKKFETGHFSITDEPREGRPKTSTDDTNVAAVKKILDEDARMTEETIAYTLGTNAMAISRILNDSLGYTKKCARWVPRLLGEEEKAARVRFAKFFLEKFRDGQSANYNNLITGDETWIYNNEPETKLQSSVWSEKGQASPVKAFRQRSKERF